MADSKVAQWVEGYIKAWKSNEPQDIAALFTADAEYRNTPHAQPWKGRDAIVQKWLERRDEPGTWTFRYEVLVEGTDPGIARGWASYNNPPKNYDNLWIIRLDEQGRAREFTEWWMKIPDK